MADRKISDLTALTTPASGDFLPIVDISEAAAASKNKRITIEELMRGVPDGTAAAPGIAFETDPNTGIYRPGADQLAVATNGSERARIDSSGRLLVGTSTARSIGTQNWGIQQEGTTFADTGISTTRNSDNQYGSYLTFGKSRGAVGSNTVVANDDELGTILFAGADGSDVNSIAAWIRAQVDGTPDSNDMPGRLVFSTTSDSASNPTERMRITRDGVQAYNQPAPAAVNATATLTVANLKAGIITSTSAAATDMTLPTGTDTQAGFSGTYNNFTFEWSVINTGPSLVGVLAATAHTIVGSGSVATGTSGRFASRRTATNTFVTYRLS